MSMIRCEHCEHIIDSDDDPECFLPATETQPEMVLCEWCREELPEVE